MLIKIDWELKDLGKLKEALYHPIPSLILEKDATPEEQAIDFNILQSPVWKMI
jgi:hypothetical protein